MAEYIPLSSPESEDDDEDEKDSSAARSKKSVSLGRAAGIGSVVKGAEQAINKERPKPTEVTGFDRLLAHLSLERISQDQKEAKESHAEEDEAASEESADTSQQTAAPESVVASSDPDGAPEQLEPSLTAAAPLLAREQSQVISTEYIQNIPGEIALPVATEQEATMLEAETEEKELETPAVDPVEVAAEQVEEADEPEDSTPPAAVWSASSPPPASGSRRSGGAPPGSGGGSNASGAMPTQPQSWGGHRPYRPNVPPQILNNPNQAPQPQTTIETAPAPAVIERPSGFWTGALLAGGIEHIRHRRREKKMTKNHQAVLKKHEELTETSRWDHIREDEAAKARAAFATKYKAPEAPPTVEKTIEQAPVTAVIGAAHTRLETLRAEKVKQEVLELPPEHHVERSAWLSTEVDKQGNVVETPHFEYGKEYYKERARERAPVDSTTANAIKGTVASGGTLQGSSMQSSRSPQTNNQPSNLLPSSKPATDKTPLQHITQPPTTPFATAMWALVLLILLIIITIVIW
ncbi:MAG TPA: hypothetical protein PLT04_03415 [Candidatus Saccharibacteria bacterium]|nr:hypothetical protein [Candidatus Saccharibacteria bacterium]